MASNLLVNGSFEASPIGAGQFGGFSAVAGWTALSGSSIELWNNLNGVQATNGVNYGELDYVGAHDGFFQNVQTVAGQSYTLSFDARSRPGLTASTCSIEVLWNNTVVATVPPGNAWATHTFSVTGTGGQDRLTFREVQSQSADGLGALYDNISLSAANPGGLQPPVAVDDSAATNEDAAAIVAPLANDSDPNPGTTLAIVAIAGQAVSANGSVDVGQAIVTLNPNGTFTVAPDPNVNGPLSFEYTVSNGTLTDVGRVTLNIAPVADSPVVAAAIADQTATANQAFAFTVPANSFTDVDGDALVYSARLASGAALPSWLAFSSATRTFSGTPGTANVGPLSVQVVASDGALSVADTFTLTVGSAPPSGANLLVNGSFEASPIGAGQFGGFSAVAGWTALSGSSIELWNNLNGVQATNGVNYGELDYVGAHDGFFQNVQTVAGQSYTLSFDARSRPGLTASTCSIEVLWNNTVVATVPPGNAWATHTFSVTGTGGQDRLTFREVQSQSADGLGALYDNISLSAANPGGLQPPVAVDDSAATNEDAAAIVAPLANDSDPNPGTTLAIVAIAGQAVSANGSVDVGQAIVTLNPNGTFTVAPDPNVNGPLSFEYTVSNGTLTDVGRVTLNIAPVADSPVVAAAIADQTATANQAFAFTVPANSFTDVDGDALVYSARLASGAALPSWLAFSSTTRTFSGTPGTANVGPLSVQVVASDGALSVADTFTLTVGSAPPSGANLLVNGSFEASPIGAGQFGGFSAVAGWTALSGSSIELWNNLNGVQATNGVNYGELDYVGAHDGFFQNVQTVAGQSYTLSFDARSRPGLTASTCSIEVLWNNTVVATVPPGNAWATHTFSVTGTGGQDRLTFREVQSQSADGLGALYDNISLSAANPPDGTLLSFANTTDRAKIVDLSAGFWADAARILPLGNSNTYGWSTSTPQPQWEGYRFDLWRLVTQNGLWIDYVGAFEDGPPTLPDRNHQGVLGITSTEVAGLATQIATAQRPNAVLLMLGTNDALRKSNASTTVPGELLTIMQRIDAVMPDVTILLAPLPPIDPAVANATFGGGFLSNADAIRDAINAQLPNLVSQAQALGINAVFVPVPSLSTADLIDGVHLTDGGYAQLAAAWYAALSANPATDAGTFGGDPTAISGVVNVNGSELGDALRGNAAANRLDGRGGADRIEGAGGSDILTGGSGRDNFVFNLPTEGIDIVADFTRGEDLIQISATGFGGGLAANAAVTVINAANFATTTSGAAGTFIFDNAGADAGTVYWDANGGSGADATALVTLQNVTSLTSSDFDVA